MYVILLAPSSNRVYAGEAERLMAAELSILLAGIGVGADVGPVQIAGVSYLQVESDALPTEALQAMGAVSGVLALFERVGNALHPFQLRRPDVFDDDLVTIPKYPGKTNEQFTRLMLNVTLASAGPFVGRVSILDPLCGRGTTLSTALTLGHDGCGVEVDSLAVEAYAAFLRTYLRRKRLKHSLEMNPVRREGRSVGQRLDVQIKPFPDGAEQSLRVFTGDTRDSAALFGKRTFPAIVTDAPYGVAHGSRTDDHGSGKRHRSPTALLREALPVWAGQLRPGGALGLSWNTFGLSRPQLTEMAGAAGLEPLDTGAYLQFGHRVDSSINRDVFVARRPRRAAVG